MINAHGGELINKILDFENLHDVKEKAKDFYNLEISNRLVSDCEMIANGSFSPLNGFMNKTEALSVIENMTLTNGLVWSIPILLNVSEEHFTTIKNGENLALFDKFQRLIAILYNADKFDLDLDKYCQSVFKTTDDKHAGVAMVKSSGNKFVSGEIKLVNRPVREDIELKYFLDPSETRNIIKEKGWKTVSAFQTRNPIHRAHEYLIKCVVEQLDGVLIHPLVGETKSDDIPANVRMKCYETLIDNYFNKANVHLSVLPATMNYAGPREAVHHAIIRQNYGCTHIIIGRDHAGVGNYYGTYEAQELIETVKDKLEIKAINFEHTFFCKKCNNLASSKTCPHNSENHLILSGTKVRDMLRAGEIPPEEFTRSEIAEILIEWSKQG